jgi:hypothetical protein
MFAMKKRFVLFAACVLAAPLVFANADRITELKNQIIEIQNRTPLAFQNFHFCSNILGFGSYVPMKEPAHDKNGKMLVYYEPANVFTNVRDGLYEIWYTQDFALLKADGTPIQEWKDFLSFRYSSKKPVLDLFAQNSLDLQGALPPGTYRVRLTLHDRFSESEATREAEFRVLE